MQLKPNKRMLRSEVPTEMTWDLTHLFVNQSIWKESLFKNEKKFEEIAKFKGKLCTSAQTLYDCLVLLEDAYEEAVRIGTYSNLKQSEDATNPENQENSMLYASVSTRAQAKASFISSEVTSLSEDEYSQLFIDLPQLSLYKNYLDDLYKQKQHMLTPETELTLSSLGEVFNAPYRTYQISKGADMQFDDFETNGDTFPNSFALFETKYEFTPDNAIRRAAYVSFTKTLTMYNNTYAALYATEVKKQVTISKLRGYNSVTEMLLEPHKVSLEMYNRQIDIIFNQLAPHMRRFATIKKEQLGLDQIQFCDLKAPLDSKFNPPANYESIQNVITEALGILGDDYTDIIKQAFENRWIDYSDNVGKSTGAFCASPYGVHSYILISYQESMRSAFTLAHELGHAGHFNIANRNQRIFDTRPSTYFVEAPSTMNEILLANHLMKSSDSAQMKRWVILQLMSTYYHNFVTHLLEAEFQRRVYAHVENGGSLTAKTLNTLKLSVIKEFWGDAVEIDEDAGMTWMRQPHYYMGLYPYTYSAGLTASTAVAKQIFEEGKPAVDRWLSVLAAGGTLDPHGLMLKAGIDMSSSAPIENAVNYVGELISELEALFKS